MINKVLFSNFICFFLLLVSGLKAQKPEIQVGFRIDPDIDIAFRERFEEDLEDINSRALPILIDGLNEYIGFAKFVPDIAPIKLKITLKDKSEGSMYFVPEYWLLFELTDTDGDKYEHEWQYLDNNEFNAAKSSIDVLLEKLVTDWDTYLQKSYNKELVTNLFDKVSLALPDSTHYYIDADSGIKEAILPFKKEFLQINPDKSEFRVVVTGEMGDGVETTSIELAAHASGEVVPEMFVSGVPLLLEGCIRIELKSLTLSRLLNGQVYITNYMRKKYEEETLATSNDFYYSNPDRP